MDYKLAVKNLEKHMDYLRLTRREVLKEAWPEYEPMWHVVEVFWDCPKSPFGYCAYDKVDDPAWDTCLFCGEPYERK